MEWVQVQLPSLELLLAATSGWVSVECNLCSYHDSTMIEEEKSDQFERLR